MQYGDVIPSGKRSLFSHMCLPVRKGTKTRVTQKEDSNPQEIDGEISIGGCSNGARSTFGGDLYTTAVRWQSE
jgi:hypothetical protein